MPAKIKFRDYSKYPPEIIEACHFRDDFDDQPDGMFFALAEERGLTNALIEMAEWEMENTTVGEKTG